MSKFDFSGGRLKPLDGTFCYWSSCGEPPTTAGLCAEHAVACKCRGTSHFPGEGCDSRLNEAGVCGACVDECTDDGHADAGLPQPEEAAGAATMTTPGTTLEERALRWIRVGQRWRDEDGQFVTICEIDPGTWYPVQFRWDGEPTFCRHTAAGFLADFQPPNLLVFLESIGALVGPDIPSTAAPETVTNERKP